MSDAPSPSPVPQKPVTSSYAIASLILGFLGVILFVPAIPAIICGHVSRRQIRRSPGALAGRGMATAGIALGYFGLIAWSSLMPVFNTTAAKTPGSRDLSQAKEIWLGIRLYEVDNDNHTPSSIGDLFPTYLPDRRLFTSPLAPDDHDHGYDFLRPDADAKTFDEKTTLLIRSHHADRSGYRSYVYADGHGEFKRDPTAESHWW